MRELNLLDSYPKATRIIQEGWRKEENKIIAKQYGKEFFDGDRVNGYGGYYYDGRWKKVVEKLKQVYGINSNSSVLDIGCGKGFLLHDLLDMIPGIKVAGIDISEYAINKALDKLGIHTMKQITGKQENELTAEELEKAKIIEEQARSKILPHMIIGSCEKLPYPDKSFDVVLAINTIHNLPEDKCLLAIKEMMRVCKGNNIFIQVDAHRNEEEKTRMQHWILTAETFKSADEWVNFYKQAGYDGDYYWTVF